jgi:beta-xylosidase
MRCFLLPCVVLLTLHNGIVLGADSPVNQEVHPTQPEARSAGKDLFLFCYFRDNGQDGLHLAFSRDGYRWTALNHGRSFLAPQVGNKLMRDPCLAQGPDGLFHLVWTTGWGDRAIGHASSHDLIRWSPQQAIPVMMHEPAARNAWAPELFYDQEEKQFLIFWATTIPGRFPATDRSGDDGWNHRIYATSTRDFKTFTPTRLFFNGGFNVIDATILKARGQYYLIVKDETKTPIKKNLRIARSAKAEGPYQEASAPISISWVEGPSAIQIGKEFLIYFDHYGTPQYYGALRSRDLVHWEDISQQVNFPKGTRHGTVLRASEGVITNLQRNRPSS